uniref:Uncharacterized protein n=1 Tax=Latimeria chalumnae TaxID=7897 RepID=H3A3R9_LATCH
IKSQIDHFCLHKKFKSSLRNVRAFCGTDIASDHQILCIATMEIKLKQLMKKKAAAQRINIARLKDQVFNVEFKLQLSNMFDTLAEMENMFENVEDAWTAIKKVYIKSTELVLGHTKGKNEELLSTNIWHAISEWKKAKLNLFNA